MLSVGYWVKLGVIVSPIGIRRTASVQFLHVQASIGRHNAWICERGKSRGDISFSFLLSIRACTFLAFIVNLFMEILLLIRHTQSRSRSVYRGYLGIYHPENGITCINLPRGNELGYKERRAKRRSSKSPCVSSSSIQIVHQIRNYLTCLQLYMVPNPIMQKNIQKLAQNL